ncbi:NAD-dependent epimerase/dehydratase family protein [Deltaproteobacteria bacterium OttesenSCG-928-K17]|nr:NAD-dependent epimerase/dehydratase family protein [Deltaproteobacteria bacterium OttesenSCG-928-K17]
MSKKYIVTGGAGFIGSNICDHLLEAGHQVTAVDNFSTGQEQFLAKAAANPAFKLARLDLLDRKALNEVFSQGADAVFHLSANADVRFGPDHPGKDLEQNIIATHNVLEAMRLNGIGEIAFSSTGSVYGEAKVIPTPEDAPFPVQTSLYAASKLSGEGLISAYSESFGFRAHIFRFVSILGERYTHGHVFDFVKYLRDDSTRLPVLGDGHQRKSYLHVKDCVSAIMTAMEKSRERVGIFNLGADGYCTVRDSIGWICRHLDVKPELIFSGGDRGWIGDNPFIYLKTDKIRSLGWSNKFTIKQGVEKTVDWLLANPWVFEARS